MGRGTFHMVLDGVLERGIDDGRRVELLLLLLVLVQVLARATTILHRRRLVQSWRAVGRRCPDTVDLDEVPFRRALFYLFAGDLRVVLQVPDQHIT